jgi:hypothetical protein
MKKMETYVVSAILSILFVFLTANGFAQGLETGDQVLSVPPTSMNESPLKPFKLSKNNHNFDLALFRTIRSFAEDPSCHFNENYDQFINRFKQISTDAHTQSPLTEYEGYVQIKLKDSVAFIPMKLSLMDAVNQKFRIITEPIEGVHGLQTEMLASRDMLFYGQDGIAIRCSDMDGKALESNTLIFLQVYSATGACMGDSNGFPLIDVMLADKTSFGYGYGTLEQIR